MNTNSSPSNDPGKQIRLNDGRMFGYAEYGDPQGSPVFFFHGWPGSRLFLRSQNSQTFSAGVRLIACERPGFGLSDFQKGRKLLHWPSDVAELADILSIGKFAVAGHSGGGPYVLACLGKLADRITNAALVSSFAPLNAPQAVSGMMGSNKLMFSLAKNAPWFHRVLLSMMLMGGIEKFMKSMIASLPIVDKNIMSHLEKGEEDISEAFKHGVKGPAWDQYILVRPWGFRLEDISAEVYLWQGDQDVMVPLSMGQYLARTLPKCHSTFCTGEGHMLIFSHWSEILGRLTGRPGF